VMLPAVGHGQESTMSGTVTDSTGAVIPGVTMRATNIESGNTFSVVTPVRPQAEGSSKAETSVSGLS
jgi:hypothetical protein